MTEHSATIFALAPFDPLPRIDDAFDPTEQHERGVIALDTHTKYQFLDGDGAPFHEYQLPSSAEIANCGGYVDKIFKYRDPELRRHLEVNGISKASFASAAFPILATRSPQLDLLLLQLIQHLRRRNGGQRLSLFDLGCSVGEHYDILNVLLEVSIGQKAAEILSYCGLDKSALLLTTARLIHAEVPAEHFRLVHEEGSKLDFPDQAFDLSLTVGVVNHVADPQKAIDRLLRGTRHAAVMALWVTSEEDGFYAFNHSGLASYFFSHRDLAALQKNHPQGRFLVAEFIPETSSSQRRSYVGIDAERERSLGCYHLVYTTLADPPFAFSPLVF